MSTSAVWQYFTKATLKDGSLVVYCNFCDAYFKHTGGTTTFRRHLEQGRCPRLPPGFVLQSGRVNKDDISTTQGNDAPLQDALSLAYHQSTGADSNERFGHAGQYGAPVGTHGQNEPTTRPSSDVYMQQQQRYHHHRQPPTTSAAAAAVLAASSSVPSASGAAAAAVAEPMTSAAIGAARGAASAAAPSSSSSYGAAADPTMMPPRTPTTDAAASFSTAMPNTPMMPSAAIAGSRTMSSSMPHTPLPAAAPAAAAAAAVDATTVMPSSQSPVSPVAAAAAAAVPPSQELLNGLLASRKMRTRSKIWDIFTEIDGVDGKCSCNFCGSVLVGGRSKGTRGLWNHLKACKRKPSAWAIGVGGVAPKQSYKFNMSPTGGGHPNFDDHPMSQTPHAKSETEEQLHGTEVYAALAFLDLTQYADKLITELGFERMSEFAVLSRQELIDFGLKMGHAIRVTQYFEQHRSSVGQFASRGPRAPMVPIQAPLLPLKRPAPSAEMTTTKGESGGAATPNASTFGGGYSQPSQGDGGSAASAAPSRSAAAAPPSRGASSNPSPPPAAAVPARVAAGSWAPDARVRSPSTVQSTLSALLTSSAASVASSSSRALHGSSLNQGMSTAPAVSSITNSSSNSASSSQSPVSSTQASSSARFSPSSSSSSRSSTPTPRAAVGGGGGGGGGANDDEQGPALKRRRMEDFSVKAEPRDPDVIPMESHHNTLANMPALSSVVVSPSAFSRIPPRGGGSGGASSPPAPIFPAQPPMAAQFVGTPIGVAVSGPGTPMHHQQQQQQQPQPQQLHHRVFIDADRHEHKPVTPIGPATPIAPRSIYPPVDLQRIFENMPRDLFTPGETEHIVAHMLNVLQHHFTMYRFGDVWGTDFKMVPSDVRPRERVVLKILTQRFWNEAPPQVMALRHRVTCTDEQLKRIIFVIGISAFGWKHNPQLIANFECPVIVQGIRWKSNQLYADVKSRQRHYCRKQPLGGGGGSGGDEPLPPPPLQKPPPPPPPTAFPGGTSPAAQAAAVAGASTSASSSRRASRSPSSGTTRRMHGVPESTAVSVSSTPVAGIGPPGDISPVSADVKVSATDVKVSSRSSAFAPPNTSSPRPSSSSTGGSSKFMPALSSTQTHSAATSFPATSAALPKLSSANGGDASSSPSHSNGHSSSSSSVATSNGEQRHRQRPMDTGDGASSSGARGPQSAEAVAAAVDAIARGDYDDDASDDSEEDEESASSGVSDLGGGGVVPMQDDIEF